MPVPTTIDQLSTTAASNYPSGSDSPATLDDVQRAHGAFIAQIRDGVQVTNASAKTTPVDADYLPINDSAASNLIKKVTWANVKATLKTYFDTLYATVGAFAAAGANADITSLSALTNGIVGTSGNQTIAGVKTFSSMPVVPTQSMIRVNTANGFGSTNTCIKRYTTTVVSQGSDITYADSATLGATFTINTNGVYVISGQVIAATASYLGASLNSAQGTTSINTITAADRLIGCAGVGGNPGSFSVGVYLASGAVIRPHSDGSVTSVAASENFTVTRVG